MVVDFTKKTTSEIFDYLKSHTGTCGKFRPSQVELVPVAVKQNFSLRLKRFSAAIYFVFGSLLFSLASCGRAVADSPGNQEDSIYDAQINAQQDHLQDSFRLDSIDRHSLKSGSAEKSF